MRRRGKIWRYQTKRRVYEAVGSTIPFMSTFSYHCTLCVNPLLESEYHIMKKISFPVLDSDRYHIPLQLDQKEIWAKSSRTRGEADSRGQLLSILTNQYLFPSRSLASPCVFIHHTKIITNCPLQDLFDPSFLMFSLLGRISFEILQVHDPCLATSRLFLLKRWDTSCWIYE